MKTDQLNTALRAVVQQTTNNTTTWIGHRQGETRDRLRGQTFICPLSGQLDCIEIFSNCVTNNGPVDLSIHPFNTETKVWGPALQTSKVELHKSDSGTWVAFPLNGLQLQKGSAYGFRLKSNGGLIGVGEAAGIVDHLPYTDGLEWVATSDDQQGTYFTYLSLAFKVEMRA